MNSLSPISLQSFLSPPTTRQRSRQWSWARSVCTKLVCIALCWGMFPGGATGVTPAALALDVRESEASGTTNHTIDGTSRLFPDFRGTGRPGNHGSGASRGICPITDDDDRLTLLVPEEAKYGGYTTEANPNLWAYVPYILNADSPITFYLLDGDSNMIYETFHVIEHEPGLLKLDLPASVTLETGQVYEWYFMIHCGDPDGMDVASFASGWIERVADPVTDELTHLPLVEQSNTYANHLIWYDALNILAEGLLSAPNDPQVLEAWTDLLGLPSVKLDVVSTEPIRDCCSLPEQL